MNTELKDERVEKNITKALANAGLAAGMILSAKVLYEIVTGSATLSTTGWDIGLLIIMGIVTYISLYRTKTIQVPKTLLGQTLSTELSKKAKKERLIKSYIPESIVAAVGLYVGTYFSSGYNGILPAITIWLIFFVIYLGITYFWNEHEIKRYNSDLEE